MNKKSPQISPWHQWEFPASAWSRLHIDFAKPLLEMFIVLVEAHSEQLEVAVVPSCLASSATHFLQKMFATDGLPDQNETAFSSDEYQAFLKWNIICHTSACKQWSCGTLCANIQGGPQEVKNGHRDPPLPLFANHLTPPTHTHTHTLPLGVPQPSCYLGETSNNRRQLSQIQPRVTRCTFKTMEWLVNAWGQCQSSLTWAMAGVGAVIWNLLDYDEGHPDEKPEQTPSKNGVDLEGFRYIYEKENMRMVQLLGHLCNSGTPQSSPAGDSHLYSRCTVRDPIRHECCETETAEIHGRHKEVSDLHRPCDYLTKAAATNKLPRGHSQWNPELCWLTQMMRLKRNGKNKQG